MTEPHDLQAQLSKVQGKIKDFSNALELPDIERDIAWLQDKTKNIPEALQKLRDQGYRYAGDLEEKVTSATAQWEQLKTNLSMEYQSLRKTLRGELADVQKLEGLAGQYLQSPQKLQPALAQLETTLQNFETRVKQAQSQIKTQYEALHRDMQQLTTQVSKLEWMLKIRDEAGFAFAHDESMYLVAEAEWVNKQDNPNGFLFVTNQRIVFEQKEKTGKKFGLFGGKQTQDVKLDFPLSSVTHVEPENKGFLGGKDLLHLKLGAPATFADVTIEVKGGVSAKDWAEHIQRAVRGDIESEVVQ